MKLKNLIAITIISIFFNTVQAMENIDQLISDLKSDSSFHQSKLSLLQSKNSDDICRKLMDRIDSDFVFNEAARYTAFEILSNHYRNIENDELYEKTINCFINNSTNEQKNIQVICITNLKEVRENIDAYYVIGVLDRALDADDIHIQNAALQSLATYGNKASGSLPKIYAILSPYKEKFKNIANEQLSMDDNFTIANAYSAQLMIQGLNKTWLSSLRSLPDNSKAGHWILGTFTQYISNNEEFGNVKDEIKDECINYFVEKLLDSTKLSETEKMYIINMNLINKRSKNQRYEPLILDTISSYKENLQLEDQSVIEDILMSINSIENE